MQRLGEEEWKNTAEIEVTSVIENSSKNDNNYKGKNAKKSGLNEKGSNKKVTGVNNIGKVSVEPEK